MVNTYQNQLQEYLQQSTLTPAIYVPSNAVKQSKHVAVCISGKPILLTGPKDDSESIRQAKALCESQTFSSAIAALGLIGEVNMEVVSGDQIAWPKQCEAVAMSKAGVIEVGGDYGDLMTINLTQNRGLTTLLCVNSDLAQIIEAGAPDMCDGSVLPYLAGQVAGELKFN